MHHQYPSSFIQMKYQKIADQIIDLKNQDLALRDSLIEKRQLEQGYHKAMEELHNSNAKILNEIIDEIGYPTIEKVGPDAHDAAWLIIQHSISQPNFMKKCLQLLEDLVIQQKAKPIHLAYLSDRIATFEGRAQLYGTQFDWDENGELSPNAYDDLTKLNNRRKSIGLNTLEDQILVMRQQAKKENQIPPKDLRKRKIDFDLWRKKVGWIN